MVTKKEEEEGWEGEEDEEEYNDDEEKEEDPFCSDSIQHGSFDDGTTMFDSSTEELEEEEDDGVKYRGMEFYCEVCDVEVTSIVALQDHFAGAKHQKRLKQVGLDVDLTDLVKGPSNPELKRKLLRCKLCDVIVRGSEMLVHTRCATHQEKMQFFDSGDQDEDEDESIWFNEVAINPDSFLKSLDDGFHCDLCGVTLPSNDLFRKHLDGKRHQKRLRWEFLEQTEDDHGDSNQMQYWCKICNIFCTSKEALDKHFLGKKHAKMLKSKGVVSEENGSEDGVDSASAKQDNYGDSNQVQFWCRICNIYCTCQDALDKHLVGKKHAKVLRSKRVADEENGGEDGVDSASAKQDVKDRRDSASSKKKNLGSDYYSSSERGSCSGHDSYSRHSSSSDHGHSSSGYRRHSASEYGCSSSDHGLSADRDHSAHSSSGYSSSSSHDYSAPSSSDYDSSSRYDASEYDSTSGHRSASQYGSSGRIVKLEYDDDYQSPSPSHQSNDHKHDQLVCQGKQTSIYQHEQPFSIHQYEQPLSLRRYEQESYNVYERPPSFHPERPTSSTSLKSSCHPKESPSTRSFAVAPLLKSICEEHEPDSTSSEDVEVKVFDQIASKPQEVKCVICNKMLQSNAEISEHLDSKGHLRALYQSTNNPKQLQSVVVPVRKL